MSVSVFADLLTYLRIRVCMEFRGHDAGLQSRMFRCVSSGMTTLKDPHPLGGGWLKLIHVSPEAGKRLFSKPQSQFLFAGCQNMNDDPPVSRMCRQNNSPVSRLTDVSAFHVWFGSPVRVVSAPIFLSALGPAWGAFWGHYFHFCQL